jgi:peroxiredoxin family protein
MTMRKIILIVLLMLSFGVLPAFAEQGNEKSFLIHAKTALNIDDAQICAVPNVAWTALSKGYEVTILFDASGVTALKKGGIFGGDKSPLDKAALPERERKSLAGQLAVPLENVPHDYGEYIRFLKQKGIHLFANRTMMLLYKIDEKEIEQDVIPIGLEEMVKLFENADIYVAY